jgi:hypothetical protein
LHQLDGLGSDLIAGLRLTPSTSGGSQRQNNDQ